jgi:hypothetical protein
LAKYTDVAIIGQQHLSCLSIHNPGTHIDERIDHGRRRLYRRAPEPPDLLDRGDRVAVLDNLSTGSLENIQALRGSSQLYSFAIDDIANALVLDRLASQADAIVHLAAAVGVQLVVERPTETIETNVLGTHAVLAAARRYRCRTLMASTSEVYGKGRASVPFARGRRPAARLHQPQPVELCREQAAGRVSGPGRAPRVWPAGDGGALSSTRSGRGRPGATAWWCPALCARRCKASRFRIYGDGAADALLLPCAVTRCAPLSNCWMLDHAAETAGEILQHRQPARKSRSSQSGADGD